MLEQHLINEKESVRQALRKLNDLAIDAVLFVVSEEGKLLGSLTDGDFRRGFLKELDFNSSLLDFVQTNPVYISGENYTADEIKSYRKRNLKIIPVTDDSRKVISIINLRLQRAALPVDAIIMAGGEGQRLRPLTEHLPKPLLKIGGKPIIEHNIDRLAKYGIKNVHISLRYLGQKIEDYFRDNNSNGIHIHYIWETEPLGTLGAICRVKDVKHEDVLVMNSDLLTDIDFEDFYLSFKKTDADLAIASVPYQVKVPYAVLNVHDEYVVSFEEKPTYTYYSNAGIYLLKKHCIDLIPRDCSYNATDLIEALIQGGKKVISFPMLGYWLDIGKPEDFIKAQADIHHLNL